MDQMIEDRFWAKVEKTEACWTWAAAKNRGGYGVYRGRGAHRFAYEFTHRIQLSPEVPLDHLCRNRACVNPAHLEPVTVRENTLRGEGPAAVNARKTHCVHGHPLSGGNLYLIPNGGGRACRRCRHDAVRRYRGMTVEDHLQLLHEASYGSPEQTDDRPEGRSQEQDNDDGLDAPLGPAADLTVTHDAERTAEATD